MAVNRKLPGPEPLRYYPDPTYRLRWVKLTDVSNYWAVMHQGEHVGELYKGKSGWIGIVFGAGGFVCQKRSDCARHIAGQVLNRRQ